jgi:predicted dehydrogenase
MTTLSTILLTALLSNASAMQTDTVRPWRFITLDPGHFHAALVQKKMYPEVSPEVHVYAPEGNDLKLHMARIDAYNKRGDQPTRWQENVYTGSDYLERMLSEKKGDVVVLAGNNRKKTEYILRSIKAGYHVYADKPMAIDPAGFRQLQQAFQLASRKGLMLYDIMTERFEIATILQRELSMQPAIFGSLLTGTAENPAITKESVHHFYKEVSGSPLQRPPWFYDIKQEGAGIVDVTTHLVDMVQWEGFPEQAIDYRRDIEINSARRWNTAVTLAQFTASTATTAFPDYLQPYLDAGGVLQVPSNGEINYRIKGIHAKVSVIWNYRAEPGAGDTHYSIMRGSLSDLVIRQGRDQKFVPTLYIERKEGLNDEAVEKAFAAVEQKYPGITLIRDKKGWTVGIPTKYHNGHEAHFAQVTEKYLQFLKTGKMPAWEIPNMLAKYHVTTEAFKLSER